ncbi:MAG: hypothetical protein ABL959_14230 [Pyrinomonadaceae bacterium]
MERFRKSVEIGSNVAIILLAVLLGYFVVDRVFAKPTPPAAGAEASTIKPGTKITAKSIDFQKSEKNLVLVLSTACKYCTESVPFYQRLVERNAADKKLQIVATFAQEPAEAARYLIDKNLSVDQIVKADPSEIQVRGTPTLILTDKNGTVLESWAGKLSSDKENEVAERVFSSVVVEMN